MTAGAGMTLEEALSSGQGTERPFRCTEHDDTTASASVNVAKGVWFCHACHASGAVDGKKKAPSLDILESMLNPERAPRLYPQTWLELFALPNEAEGGLDCYWPGRGFPLWLCHAMQLGQDPFTGDATFAVRTPQGRLAGIGRRHVTEDKKARYLYPNGWSAAMSISADSGAAGKHSVIVLVEGRADAASLWQVGIPAFAVYGAGVHKPQIELIHRLGAQVIVLGFDMDAPGEKAVSRAFSQLSKISTLSRARWSGSDPAAIAPTERISAVRRAVTRAGYSSDPGPEWAANVESMKADYELFLEGEQ